MTLVDIFLGDFLLTLCWIGSFSSYFIFQTMLDELFIPLNRMKWCTYPNDVMHISCRDCLPFIFFIENQSGQLTGIKLFH